MKIDYNSPVVLTFILGCFLIQGLTSTIIPNLNQNLFMVYGQFTFGNPLDYFRLFSHIMGHGDFNHLFGNSIYLLLLGPILEERYGSLNILFVMLVTAIFTAFLNIILFDTAVLGASGVVFAFIVLSSIVNVKEKHIPLSFILVFVVYVGGEILNIFSTDNISQTAHIVGGLTGAVMGFGITKKRREQME